MQSFGGYHYFRRPGFKRVPLPGIVGSAEFMAAYQAALGSTPEPVGASTRSKPGSVSAAIAGYYQSQAFRALRGGSPAMRRAILERFREAHGTKSIALLPRKFVVVLLDTMEPFAARNWLKAIRALMKHCIGHGLVNEDPTQGVRLPPIKSDGHHTWSEDEIAQFEAAHPIGSKARLAFALLLYTAQRRGDVIRMGPQHVQNGELRVVQKKTRKPLILPIRPELQAVLDATPIGHLTFLVTKSGKPYPANDFSEQFRVWCNAAGLPTACVVHGLRKAACRRMAEAGYSVSEIAAWSGHRTLSEIKRYTDGVDQARLARNALQREQNGTKAVKPEQILTVSKG
ncbi:MAG: tyrosine-type recombinase/integrase [Xanthobacteraceae bacterium]